MSSGRVATQYSYDFIRRHLPADAQDVLEIGCGEGELAERLAQNGLHVIALDSDEQCVDAAKARGVEARAVTWPVAIDRDFDAILFTRSLHHIDPLNGAVDAAVAALRPGGSIIVEDFRFELESARTTAWFLGLMRLFGAAGILRTGAVDRLAEKFDFGEHEHELHSSVAIAQALGRQGPVHEESAAYYFRYAEPEIDEALGEQLLRYELHLIETGAIDALGKRFVLIPR